MRVNLYSEELTDRTEIVEKQSADGPTFYGLRVCLKTHPDLVPPVHPDDDTAAVTFWFASPGALHDWFERLRLRHGF